MEINFDSVYRQVSRSLSTKVGNSRTTSVAYAVYIIRGEVDVIEKGHFVVSPRVGEEAYRTEIVEREVDTEQLRNTSYFVDLAESLTFQLSSQPLIDITES